MDWVAAGMACLETLACEGSGMLDLAALPCCAELPDCEFQSESTHKYMVLKHASALDW